MNLSILKHSFWALGALLFACNKPATTPATNTGTPQQNIPATTAKENLLWIPVGEAKTLQTAEDLLGTAGTLAEIAKDGKTKFTKPTANPKQTTLTNEYELTVNLDDIKPKGSSTSDKSKFLGVRLMVQGAGVSYTVLRSLFPDDTKKGTDTEEKNISFDVVTEAENSTNATAWKEELKTHLNPNPEPVIYDAAKPKHTLVLFNGSGPETDTKLFKEGNKATLLLVVQKGTESQVVKLVINFVAAAAGTAAVGS